jgi:hypothetical protein
MKHAKLISVIALMAVGASFVLGGSSCASRDTAGDLDEADRASLIEQFVDSHNIPDAQPFREVYRDPEHDLLFFSVACGPLQDVPAGGFYDRLYGLQHQNKVGWIEEYLISPESALYAVDVSDTYLFSEDLSQKLNSADEWVYRSAFLPMLAKDTDTPVETLSRIADGLSTYIQPYVASLLLQNPVSRLNRHILDALANLPVFQGDAYKDVREQARDLIDD